MNVPLMNNHPRLLVVANCPSPNTERLYRAVLDGAQHPDIEQITVTGRLPLQADAADVLQADGIILGSTENFGYMSGLMKDFLERIYYPCLDKTAGLPVAVYIKGGLDGQGAKHSIERILTGLRWKSVQPALVLKGQYQPSFEAQCRDLGTYMAAGLESRIF